MHVVRGLVQALVLLVAGTAVACTVAGVWAAVADGDLRSRLGVALLVVAGLVALVGGSLLARAGTSDVRAFLGLAPETGQAEPGGSLGPVGVFLFVCVPLAVAGLFLAG
ncbi:hypothetical protein ACI796_14855 [Geodermatophilus sp. SYSU D00525]